MSRYLVVGFVCLIAVVGFIYDRNIKRADAELPVSKDLGDALRSDCNDNGVSDEFEVAPMAGHALSFDGLDDYVDPGASAALGDLGLGDFTLEAWVWTEYTGHGILIGNGSETPRLWNFVIRGHESGGVIRLRIEDGTTGYQCTGQTSVTDGRWHHVAAVRQIVDGEGIILLYVDGKLDAVSYPDSVPFTADNDTLIGRDQQLSPHYFNGALDEVRVWNVGRDESEIAADMYSTLEGTEPGLVAYWRFDEGEGSIAYDSASDIDGTLVGSTWQATLTECNGNEIPDECDIVGGASSDCSGNGVPDECDIADETSPDCNSNGVPDECEPGGQEDCNDNGIFDLCDIASGYSLDCNRNGVPDTCDLLEETSLDCNGNDLPDECEPGGQADCNDNSISDLCDIFGGTSQDCNFNGTPDECDALDGMVIFSDDAEGSTESWIAEGRWAITTASSHSPVGCWTDSPGGNYSPGSNTSLTLATPLTSSTLMSLRFWTWYFTESCCDKCYVEVSGDDETWHAIGSFAGDQRQWAAKQYDLSDYAGQMIRIRFRLVVDGSVHRDGWYIDDIVITERIRDCNNNAVPDECDIASGVSLDCNSNGVPDECDLVEQTSLDCNSNGVPDECEPGGQEDCNDNGVYDLCDIAVGISLDCNVNGVPDACDLLEETSLDCNGNDVPDECEPGGQEDCNENGVFDLCDIFAGTSQDCNANGAPDECEALYGLPLFSDDVEGGTESWIADGRWGITAASSHSPAGSWTDSPDGTYSPNSSTSLTLATPVPASSLTSLRFWTRYLTESCCDKCYVEVSGDEQAWHVIGSFAGNQQQWIAKQYDLSDYAGQMIRIRFRLVTDGSLHMDGWYIDDILITERMPDCNNNAVPDECDIASGLSFDCNSNGVPDACDLVEQTSLDCNSNGVPDECDITLGVSQDCNTNSVPDSCDLFEETSLDCNSNDVPDECDIASGVSLDCNENGVPDSCDLLDETSLDCNSNNVPDECEPGGREDCDDNDISDLCEIFAGTSQDCNANGAPDECEALYGIPVFSDNAEGDTESWIAEGRWGITTASSHSPTGSWTDSPGGDYPPDSSTSLTLATELTSSSLYSLKFWTRYSIESCCDKCYVEVSGDHKAWQEIGSFAGNQQQWVAKQYDLSDYAGQMVRIRFRLVTDGSVNMDGFYIDDIVITERIHDINGNDIPDECEADCNDNGIPDTWEDIGPGDFDADGDVDLDDYSWLTECMAGPDQDPQPTEVECVEVCLMAFDLDQDNDVDLQDYAQFQERFTGAQ